MVHEVVRHLGAGPAGVVVRLELDLLDDILATGGDHLLDLPSPH